MNEAKHQIIHVRNDERRIWIKSFILFLPVIIAFTGCVKVYTDPIAAAKDGRNANVQSLLDEGADVNAKDWRGGTALMQAAQSGHIGTVRILLDRGADVNVQDHFGQTALTKAIHGNHVEIVELLKQNGAKD